MGQGLIPDWVPIIGTKDKLNKFLGVEPTVKPPDTVVNNQNNNQVVNNQNNNLVIKN